MNPPVILVSPRSILSGALLDSQTGGDGMTRSPDTLLGTLAQSNRIRNKSCNQTFCLDRGLTDTVKNTMCVVVLLV